MTITQTIDVPADRRVTLPREVPVGPTVIIFKPVADTKPTKKKLTDEEEKAHMKKHHKRINREVMDVLKDQFLDVENWEDDE